MKFLLLNTDYPEFLRWLYAQQPGLEEQPYEEQMRVRVESLFGVADFYSSNLRKLGHEAWDIHANNEFMQKAWAREHGVKGMEQRAASIERWQATLQRVRGTVAKTPLRRLKPLFRPVLRRLDSGSTWFYDVLAAQIKHYKPDVLFNQAMDGIPPPFLQEMKQYVRLSIGLGEPPVRFRDWGWRVYDLVLAPSEGMVNYFREVGLKAQLLRFAFEPRVLSLCNPSEHQVASVAFVGSIGLAHSKRRKLLEMLCDTLSEHIRIWGQLVSDLPSGSSLRACYQGYAWGGDVYSILLKSKIALNCHIDIAGQYADNMRLFEATGVGALLITDWKVNLHEIFEPGKEVVAYRSPEECAELIRYYLEHDKEREGIAKAGQQRTLREHTYCQRMQELVGIVRKYL